MNNIFENIVQNYPYLFSALLMSIGLWAMLAKHNLIKKLIGMNIFQTAIIMFFISSGYKLGATIPIINTPPEMTNPQLYINPLPHVLMLTAIVVMVATSGVSLAILILIYRRFHSLDEREILKRLKG